MKSLLLLFLLFTFVTGCRAINCIGGTPVEKPCYCDGSSTHGKCPDGGR